MPVYSWQPDFVNYAVRVGAGDGAGHDDACACSLAGEAGQRTEPGSLGFALVCRSGPSARQRHCFPRAPRELIEAYAQYEQTDNQPALADLLADCRHAADALSLDWDHYEAETSLACESGLAYDPGRGSSSRGERPSSLRVWPGSTRYWG